MATDKKERKIPCEIYSRVVGYYRPVSNWNKGKQKEFEMRKEINPNELKVKLQGN